MSKKHTFKHTKLDDDGDVGKKKTNESSGGGKITKELTEIYKERDGSLPDMTHFETRSRRRFAGAFATLFLAVVILGGVVWTALFVFQGGSSFSESDIIVSISGDEEIVIGNEARYRLRYRNAAGIPLSQVHVQVKYPDGFVFTGASLDPDSESNDVWTIGTLDTSESGFIDIFGVMYGDIDTEKSFRTFFTYLPSNFSSTFQKVDTAGVSIAYSPVILSIDVPDEAVAGVSMPVKIRVERNPAYSDIPIHMVAVEIGTESGFIKQKENHDASEFNDYRWLIENLDEPFELQVDGIFRNAQRSDSVLPIRVIGWREGQTRSDDAFVYAKQDANVTLQQTEVEINPIVNGAAGDITVAPGEPLTTSISVRNNGQQVLRDVQIRAVLDAPSYQRRSILHWAELQDDNNGDITGEQVSDDIRRGYIRWDKKHIPELAQLEPGEEVLIDFTMPIKTASDATLSDYPGSIVTLMADIQYRVGEGTQIISSVPIKVTLVSDLELEIRDQVDTQINGNDRRMIKWILTNSYHDLENITVEAEIFGATDLEEELADVPAGTILYDQESHRIVWTIEQMPVSVDVLALQFTLTRLERNPTQSQLMSKVTLKATDVATGEQILLFGDAISLNE
ncbi:MAG: hypothetical protein COU35_00565 [Candidatus Magasanikbacteria bacterium CG10_big_fil_rev_8_21_14_0_10_47_10]|uniref:DUF11 domain-containing protein n=1 Tax=Candidatus Magasanikbacteria bacterium CG10_big_fil_rev_8_21_14_0_10_47_10 TaxID=1974652 RepID=A0A2H0TRL7_9BACT|nr:MAG: hypothetical protein COU35_00565 [Candidatus Magasanikbacteria bacterium CG10_big_fil_rev_8_21_14_0_10_47_10]